MRGFVLKGHLIGALFIRAFMNEGFLESAWGLEFFFVTGFVTTASVVTIYAYIENLNNMLSSKGYLQFKAPSQETRSPKPLNPKALSPGLLSSWGATSLLWLWLHDRHKLQVHDPPVPARSPPDWPPGGLLCRVVGDVAGSGGWGAGCRRA